MRLILEEISEAGSRHLADVADHMQRIGRDLTTDIPVSSTALSRQHGLFIPFETCWVYKDLGSTNGSWHNGKKVESQKPVPLKENDYLQLADLILKASYQGEKPPENRTRLLVLKEGLPLGEYLVADIRGLSIGGESEELKIADFGGQGPVATFSNSAGRILLELSDRSVPVRLNGIILQDSVRLSMGDQLVIGEYELIAIEGTLVRGVVRPAPQRVQTQEVDLTAVDTKEPKDDTAAEVFSSTHTVLVDPARLKAKFGDPESDTEDDSWIRKPQQRFSTPHQQPSFFDFDAMSDVERRLIFGILFFVVASLILLFVWLFLL